MKKRINTIACALLVAALTAPASHARAPIAGDDVVTHVRSSAFAGLGHEGSGVRKHVAKKKNLGDLNVLAGLGHEGSALVAQLEALKLRPWAN
jgi:hypothetical protein